jgi:hypothetical protein
MTTTPGGGPEEAAQHRTGEVRFREKNSQPLGEKRRRRRTYGVRICPVDGRSFVATSSNQVYCPPTDRDRKRAPNSQPRSRCAKRADNAKQRGWDPASRPLLEPYDCAQCGKRCVPGENVPANATKFCCQAHKRAWHHAPERVASVSGNDPRRRSG